jgi:hypothetical protein
MKPRQSSGDQVAMSLRPTASMYSPAISPARRIAAIS